MVNGKGSLSRAPRFATQSKYTCAPRCAYVTGALRAS